MQLKGGPDPLQRAACQQTRCCGTFDKGEPVFCRQAERIQGSQTSGRRKAVQTAPLFDCVHVPAPCACRQTAPEGCCVRVLSRSLSWRPFCDPCGTPSWPAGPSVPAVRGPLLACWPLTGGTEACLCHGGTYLVVPLCFGCVGRSPAN